MKYLSESHIFAQHLLQPVHREVLSQPGRTDQVWMSIYLLSGTCLLVFIRYVYLQNLLRISLGNFGFQPQRRFIREDSGNAGFYSVFLGLFFIMNMAFLAYLVNSKFKIVLKEEPFITQYLFFLSVVLILMFYKRGINTLLKWITGAQAVIGEYNLISSSANHLTGVMLFPLIVLNAFSFIFPHFIFFVSLSILGFMLLLKWSRGFILAMTEQNIGILQILTYFCTLEILPQLIAVKYIIETF